MLIASNCLQVQLFSTCLQFQLFTISISIVFRNEKFFRDFSFSCIYTLKISPAKRKRDMASYSTVWKISSLVKDIIVGKRYHRW